MPPRFSYWTIILEGLPTAFRAQRAADLVPTLKQLQRRHPDAEMRWFQRGRLWASPDDARAAARANRAARSARKPATGWRPGGAHRDPRMRLKPPRAVRRARYRRRALATRKKGSG